jgi:hypothetical protein
MRNPGGGPQIASNDSICAGAGSTAGHEPDGKLRRQISQAVFATQGETSNGVQRDLLDGM